MSYGHITSFNLDMPAGHRAPETGEELLVTSPKGLSRRGDVVQSCRVINSEINPNRHKLRIMRVPVEQISPDAIEVRRYGTHLLDRRRRFTA